MRKTFNHCREKKFYAIFFFQINEYTNSYSTNVWLLEDISSTFLSVQKEKKKVIHCDSLDLNRYGESSRMNKAKLADNYVL